MAYTIEDVTGLLLAALACGVVLYLPGLAIGRLTGALGLHSVGANDALLLAPLLGYAILPATDNLLLSSLGIQAGLALNLGLAAYGVVVQRDLGAPKLGRLALAAGCIWLALVILVSVDLDWGGGLYPTLLMVDAVKHAATVRILVDAGVAPAPDPFFLRTEPSGYYYFYYIISALTERLGAGLFDSRAAFYGQTVWTGLALAGLARHLLVRSGIARTPPRSGLLLALLAVGGLQILPIICIGWISGTWLAQVNWWNDQVASFPVSLIWVPHHLTSMMATWVGLLLLQRAVTAADDGAGARQEAAAMAGLAGIAFATAAGMSIWVAATGAVAVGFWVALLAFERRFVSICVIIATGVVAALIDAVYLRDLLAYRAYAGPPVALTVRPFPFTDMLFEPGLLQLGIRILALPFDFMIEFGVLMIGAMRYWTSPRDDVRGTDEREVARLVTCTALAGLLVATFLRSIISNNDLGWRAPLYAQMAGLLWTYSMLARIVPNQVSTVVASWRMPWDGLRLMPATIACTFLIGYASIAYDVVGMRAYGPLGLKWDSALRQPDPVLERELRAAHTWLATHTAPDLVVQHNPDRTRAYPYGLYGRRAVAVSDSIHGPLFGAAETDVRQRIAELAPVFEGTVHAADAIARLRKNRIGAAVVSRRDGAWADKSAWIWSQPTLYTSANVRIIDVGAARP